MKYRGHLPRNSGRIIEIKGDWVLVERPDKSNAEWSNLKLIWLGKPREDRANYSISWNGYRLARSKDAHRLKTESRDLFDALVFALGQCSFDRVGELVP